MPRLNVPNTEQFPTVRGIQFSGIRPDKLPGFEYTLVDIKVDTTGSTGGFSKQLLDSLRAVVESCQKSPRKEYLLLRASHFNSSIGIQEIHGFSLLSQVDPSKYDEPKCDGMTNLFDATYDGVVAVNAMAQAIIKKEPAANVNGLTVIITDGDDNASRHGAKDIKAELERCIQGEEIESHMTILVGINAVAFKNKLEKFQQDAGIMQYVDAGDATPANLAKLADFVSRSISSQSSSLGSGGPSQVLTI
jgi:hypothetical protein